MRFAVIAAGEGSRLAQEGVEQPKQLVPLCGEPMIERLLRIFVDCGATEIVVIVNEWSTAVREHLEQMQLPVPLRLVVKTTPSSMHSLHALSPYLRGERFCLTTVDTIFREEEFKKYIRYFQEAKEIDGCMAVTPYVDDEKPLWVGVEKQADAEGASLLDKQGSHKKPRITGFHDNQEGDDHLISGGIYCLGDKALDVLDHCMEQGMSRMRNFQRQLVVEGLKLEAYPINKILDVDHKEDIAKAEAFIHPLEGKTLVGVCRGNEFSPNCVDNDAAIMNAVQLQLEALGAQVMLMCEKEFCRKAAVLERAYGWPRCRVTVGVDGFFSMARSKQALDVLDREYIDLIISDIMMPNMDGYELVSSLRDSGNGIPVLMITAKETFYDMQRGFSSGTDDYMVKPIDVNEMVLRVGALLRRAKMISDRKQVIGNTVLEYDSMTVTSDGKSMVLPQKEFMLLYKLTSYPGRIFTRQQLMDDIWGLYSETEPRTVDVHINRLRDRFRDNKDFEIVTIRGLGYKAVKHHA